MESRRQSRLAATRVAAAVAQEAICTLMSSSADQEFEASLQSYSGSNSTVAGVASSSKSSRSASKRDAHGSVIGNASGVDVKLEPGGKCDTTTPGIRNNASNNNNAGNGKRTCSSSPSSLGIGISSPTISLSSTKRDSMYEAYQTWALMTYGDSAKTKTVTKKKYNRIMKILKGEESTNVENSKFRFWVKAKGFRIGPVNLNENNIEWQKGWTSPAPKSPEQVLYVPCSKSGSGSVRDETIYKRVAVVENFYDIIYNVHVEMDGRSGKHAGQKRTYKAVAEMYAFLPREAVTRFLMSCADCQKRMHLQGTGNACNGIKSKSGSNAGKSLSSRSKPAHRSISASNSVSPNCGPKTALDIDYSLPLTTTIKRMRNAGFVYNVMGDSLIAPNNNMDGREDVDEEMISETNTSDHDNNGDHSVGQSDGDDALCEEITADACDDEEEDEEVAEENVLDDCDSEENALPLDMSRVKCENSVCLEQPINMCSKNSGNTRSSRTKTVSSGRNSRSSANNTANCQHTEQCNGMNMTSGNHNHGNSNRWEQHERWTTTSNHNSSSGKKETSQHEDEDEEDDEDNDQMGDRVENHTGIDPERLKAFNMFVRLFVDENLDRLVPISRQPKEKIQAIIESCARQFPEFGERARKRLRTYLKSCRRTKRHKTAAVNENGSSNSGKASNESFTSSVKTVNHVSYHLTSPMAEQILATACENECQNAKRMRMGLKPIANELSNVGHNSNSHSNASTSSMNVTNASNLTATNCGSSATSTSASAVQVFQQNNSNSNLLPFTAYQQCVSSSDNGGGALGLHNGGSNSGNASVTHSTSNNTLAANSISSTNNKSPASSSTSGNHYSLNPSEVAAVKQLIAGYRESAAFLLRSADELEQLILQQN